MRRYQTLRQRLRELHDRLLSRRDPDRTIDPVVRGVLETIRKDEARWDPTTAPEQEPPVD